MVFIFCCFSSTFNRKQVLKVGTDHFHKMFILAFEIHNKNLKNVLIFFSYFRHLKFGISFAINSSNVNTILFILSKCLEM